MKIIFNVMSTGLGNNGGSKTIIRSAETLRSLGYDCVIATNSNKCTWFPVGVPVIKNLEPCDVLIGTGYNSLKSTLNYSKTGKKLWYVRGHENWVASEKDLWRMYRSKLHLICNSERIVSWLEKNNVYAKVIYQGIDFDDLHIDGKPDHCIGGLWHKHATKRPQDCIDIANIANQKIKMLNRDFRSGDRSSLRKFFSSLKVWIWPSENEGLQNVPIEATLCGCALVLTDHPMGGTIAYAKHEETCLIYPQRDLNAAAEAVNRLMNDEELRIKLQRGASELIYNKIGTREKNMKLLVDHIRSLK